MTNEEFLKSISLEGEFWKPVVGYEGLYSISSHGRCVSHKGIEPRLLAQCIQKVRPTYIRVVYSLLKNGHRKSAKAHILVADAFLPHDDSCNQIDHIDGNTLNNHVDNLRRCNNKQNMNNPITAKRIAHTSAKDKTKSVEIVCLKDGCLVKVYSHGVKVAEDGFVPSCVSLCCKGINKQHKGYTWMYLSDYETSKSAMSKNS